MKKNLGMLMSAAVVFALILSSCASSSEEATIDTGIVERLNTATDFTWEIDIPTDKEKSEYEEYTAKGYIQSLWTTDLMKCLLGVYVFENDEYAKNAKDQIFTGDGWDDYDGIWQFEDPLTKYGIIFVDYGDPCRVDAASAFEYILPR
jgi:hypothetical protein